MPLTRRALLALMSSSTFLVSTRSSPAIGAGELTAPGRPLDFPQGVASGDPTPGSVMLWTRAVPRDGADSARVRLQVSETPDFEALDVESVLSTSAASDFTLRVHVDHLAPDRWYYYRFLGGDGGASRTGRTRTAPPPDRARPVRMAFTSCQNYEQGFYGAWARMLADDEAAPPEDQIEFVLHLGDFIYERRWDTREDGSALSRTLPPFPDGVRLADHSYAESLADYRHLYRAYLEDPWLQAARARWPFVTTWDDHEFSNDNYQSYSHYESGPRLEPRRKFDANRAWFEYIPTTLDERPGQPCHGLREADLSGGEPERNRSARDSLCIYRQLRWGRHLDLLLTDARSYRSPPCLEKDTAARLGLPMNTVKLVAIADGGRDYNGGEPPATLPYGNGDIPNPARDRDPGTCLGRAQRDWLVERAAASDATWKLWGNPLPLLPLHLDMSSIPFAGYEDSVFNIDGWMGYPGELRHILERMREAGVGGLVSFSGDHHMHGAASVRPRPRPGEASDAPVAVDFACAGISSSPVYENVKSAAAEDHPDFAALVEARHEGRAVPNWNMTLLRGVLPAYGFSRTGLGSLSRWLGPNPANPGLAFADTTAHGYGLAVFDAGELRVELVAVAGVESPFDSPPPAVYRARFTLPHWPGGTAPRLSGPEFEGEPPFPFSLSTG